MHPSSFKLSPPLPPSLSPSLPPFFFARYASFLFKLSSFLPSLPPSLPAYADREKVLRRLLRMKEDTWLAEREGPVEGTLEGGREGGEGGR
jgi:hypothetical protein